MAASRWYNLAGDGSEDGLGLGLLELSGTVVTDKSSMTNIPRSCRGTKRV
jgi:hypothetical protein